MIWKGHVITTQTKKQKMYPKPRLHSSFPQRLSTILTSVLFILLIFKNTIFTTYILLSIACIKLYTEGIMQYVSCKLPFSFDVLKCRWVWSFHFHCCVIFHWRKISQFISIAFFYKVLLWHSLTYLFISASVPLWQSWVTMTEATQSEGLKCLLLYKWVVFLSETELWKDARKRRQGL